MVWFVFEINVHIFLFFITEETMEIDSTPDLVKVKTELKKVKTEMKTEEPKIDNVDLVEKVIEKELPKEDAILHFLGQLDYELLFVWKNLG